MSANRRVGVDWGSKTHQVCRIDGTEKPKQRSFEHTSAGLRALVEFVIEGWADRKSILVAIETSQGAVVETLLGMGLRVYSINPKQEDRLRDRFSPAGAKDDRRDAFVLASCVETDAYAFREVRAEDPEVLRLRGATRLRDDLKSEHRADSNRLWAEMRDYRPELLTLCSGADEPWLWGLIERAPRPQDAAKLTLASIGRVLRQHRIRRIKAEDLQAVLRQDVLLLRPSYVESRIPKVLFLISKLKLAQAQIVATEKEILAIIEARKKSEEKSERRDTTILTSLPGVGFVTAATAIAESGTAFEERDYYVLRSLAGAAPVTIQSGASRQVVMRRVCQPRLRHCWHQAAMRAIQIDPKLGAIYARARAAGQSAGRAIRNIIDRLLWLAVQLLKKNVVYDIQLRQVA